MICAIRRAEWSNGSVMMMLGKVTISIRMSICADTLIVLDYRNYKGITGEILCVLLT